MDIIMGIKGYLFMICKDIFFHARYSRVYPFISFLSRCFSVTLFRHNGQEGLPESGHRGPLPCNTVIAGEYGGKEAAAAMSRCSILFVFVLRICVCSLKNVVYVLKIVACDLKL